MHVFEKLSKSLSAKAARRLHLSLWERIITRLNSFASDCEKCGQYRDQVRHSFQDLVNASGGERELSKAMINANQRLKNEIVGHLHHGHGLVVEGYYIATCLPLGVLFGFALGLLVFKNIALWMPLGPAIGAIIGAVRGAYAKSKGLTI
ncbi:MAG TPA: hypothetical protein GX739_01670 [Firmicutes bacterium]|nr:hypothetical protein [Bacillota bacterium]